jgi:CheY-like chemotaxis protein
MDLNLIGGMNGLEATRRIKKIPETQAIPVIIVSAVQLSSFQEEAMEAGVADFDDKPIEFDRLVGKIQALLNPS